MQENKIIKIVVIGPESTGKSVTCNQLAAHYNTTWVNEYAREYLTQNGKEYTYDDLLTIAQGQINNEENALDWCQQNNKNILFIDTDMYVMQVWCQYVFNKVHPFISNEIVNRKYDFYLLMQPDLPWAKDELREYPDLETREKLFKIYKDFLEAQLVPFAIINGNGEQRENNALQAVQSFLAQ